jgi:hypothetical protein
MINEGLRELQACLSTTTWICSWGDEEVGFVGGKRKGSNRAAVFLSHG